MPEALQATKIDLRNLIAERRMLMGPQQTAEGHYVLDLDKGEGEGKLETAHYFWDLFLLNL